MIKFAPLYLMSPGFVAMHDLHPLFDVTVRSLAGTSSC